MKRVRRNYRINPTVDAIIKIAARAIHESEADVVSYCVLAQSRVIVERHCLFTRIVQETDTPPELAKAIADGRREHLDEWRQAYGSSPKVN